MSLEIVILAAGQGTRMRSALPKVLHPVAGKAMLGHVIDTARALNPQRIHVVPLYAPAPVPSTAPVREADLLLFVGAVTRGKGLDVLLRAHIDKEDQILFPMADRLFSPEDQRELEVAFDQVEAEEIGLGVHDRYHQMAHDLAEAV